MKLLIIGSCVSRDAVEFAKPGEIELVGCYARTSFASAFGRPEVEDRYTENLTSRFQRSVVHADLAKELARDLGQKDYDLLLFDAIDERFKIFLFPNGAACTISNELLAAGFDPQTEDGQLIASATDEFYALWEEGWKLFIATLKQAGTLQKLRINEVYWSSICTNGEDFMPTYSDKGIARANGFLKRLYARMREDVPASQWITFAPQHLLGKNDHHWGKSPFHYVEEFYHHMLAQLRGERVPVAELWQRYCTGSLTASDAQLLSQASADSIDAYATGTLTELHYVDPDWKHYFPTATAKRIEALHEKLLNEPVSQEFLSMALADGEVRLPALYEPGTARCGESIYAMHRNFLRFTEDGHSFFLLQHHKSVLALYFPAERLVITYVKVDLPLASITLMNRQLVPLIGARMAQRKSHFYGIVATYGRPYHYFYDLLPGIDACLSDPSIAAKVPRMVQFTGEDFLSARDFYGLAAEDVLTTPVALNKTLAEQGAFCLRLGMPGKRNPQQDFSTLDARLLKYAAQRMQQLPHESAMLAQAAGCYPLIWFGVCAEKRAWVEQVAGIARIIERMAARYPTLGVVIDGLTRTHSETEEQLREGAAATECAIQARLKMLAPPHVPFFNLIGASAEKKMAYAPLCHAFLASFLTDSMYVARMAKKPGLAHGATVSAAFDHQHPRSVIVPKTHVKDVPGTEDNWSKVSYSIDHVLMSDLFEQMLADSLSPPAWSITQMPDGVAVTHGEGGLLIVADTCDKIISLPVNGAELRDDQWGINAHRVDAATQYDLHFHASPGAGDLTISLMAVGYAGRDRVHTSYIKPGSHAHVDFPPETTSYRYFLRLRGTGRAVFHGALAIALPKPAAPKAAPKAVAQLRDVDAWQRPIYEHGSIDAFLATEYLHEGIHAIAYPRGFLELNLYKKDAPAMCVFFNAAITRSPQMRLPAFSGKSALEAELDATIVMVSDASLYLSDSISVGWYAGASDMPLQQDLARALQHIEATLQIERSILYGGSGGGFAALFYAPLLKNAVAVACNPQIDLLRYDRGSVERYLQPAFGFTRSPSEFATAEVPNKPVTSLMDAYATDRGSRILYLQNATDGHHMEQHFLPFLQACGVPARSDALLEQHHDWLISMLGTDWGDGHLAPPKSFIFSLLKTLLAADGWSEVQRQGHALYDTHRLLMRTVSLQQRDGQLSSKIHLSDDKLQGNFTWYLFKDGQRIEIITSKTPECRFDAKPEKGIYRTAGFFRNSSVRETMKSKKLLVG